MDTPGAPHCPDYRQTHMARTEDVRPWLRANHLSQPSHIRVHNSHQLSDRECYYSVPNSSHKLTRKALSSSINCCSIMLWNSVISTKDARYLCLDIKNFYLGTPMDRFEYMKMPLDIFPQHIVDQYDLILPMFASIKTSPAHKIRPTMAQPMEEGTMTLDDRGADEGGGGGNKRTEGGRANHANSSHGDRGAN